MNYFNTFFQKCSSIQDCTSSFHYNFCFTPLHLHHPSLCFYITCTSVVCCTTICTSMNGYTSASTMFSSLASICSVCISTKCCSTTSSSSNSSMNTISTDVALGPVYFLARQCLLPLHKNSTINVPVIYMF